jgi:hypothetical protein
MAETFEITDGPDKPALQWAVAYPDRQEVHFRLHEDAVDTRIDHIEEQADGFTFKLNGRVTTGPHKDRPFEANYSIEGRTGTLRILE